MNFTQFLIAAIIYCFVFAILEQIIQDVLKVKITGKKLSIYILTRVWWLSGMVGLILWLYLGDVLIW